MNRLALLFLLTALCSAATVRSVGPGRPYATPCQAIAAAQDGDVIEIDAAGNYAGDVCAITKNNLTLRGINGRAHIDAAGQYAWGKGIWVVAGDNTVIENIEFSGARVPDRNGAGIRLDTGNLTVRNCVFHDNENGILGGAYGRVLIEHSEFYDNGYGDGQSHNIYINSGVAEFTMRYCASRRARVGHLVKSRAAVNFILYNRLTQEDGTGSYEIDLPNAGLAYVIGNIIQQSDTTQNRGMLNYGTEGLLTGRTNQLYVVNNTFVSTRSAGATFIQVSSAVTSPPVIRNNVFTGFGSMTLPSGAQMAGNVTSGDMGFLNPSQYDYRISNLSAALNAGVDPGDGSGYPLKPSMQYYHPLCAVQRYEVGPIDAGAFEYGVPETSPVCAPSVQPPPPPAPELAQWTASPSDVVSGSTVTVTVSLSAAAPAGGVSVALSSSAPAVISVPGSLTVPAGSSSASIQLVTSAVGQPTPVVLTASLDAKSLQTTVTVQPPPPPAPELAQWTASPSDVVSGSTVTVTVSLSAAAPAGGVSVALSSSAPAVISVPGSLTVPAGSSSASIQLVTSAVAQPTPVVLTASLGAKSLQTTVTVQPPVTGPVSAHLAKLSVPKAQLRPGRTFTITVRLAQPAPAGGVLVSFASGGPALRIPASAVIPAGDSSISVSGLVDPAAPAGPATLQATSANTLTASVSIRATR